ncbi:MAG TPA: nitroreductase family protein [Planctomycetota bacterium]|nr:nitroreductase family protein [Planctomycetota bacterium]
MPITLDDFEQLAKTRRTTRHFKPDPLPNGIVERLLDCARWAPSGYNLQPTHFTVVDDPALKQRLVAACMNQKQVAEAPTVVVFSGDRDVARNNMDVFLKSDREAGAIDEKYEQLLRKVIPLAFNRGPLGIGYLWKSTLPPLARFAIPVPSIPAVARDYWLAKQVALSAMNFMLAAAAAGLATVPMEGFDESRVRRVLKMPRSQHVVVVVPVGYAAIGTLKKTRLPLERMLHRNAWG